MAAIIEVKFFNTYILKKTNSTGTNGAGTAMWNGSFGVPLSLGGYPRTTPQTPDNDGTAGNWSIEESRIRGGYNNTSTDCLLYTSPSPRDRTRSRMPSSA